MLLFRRPFAWLPSSSVDRVRVNPITNPGSNPAGIRSKVPCELGNSLERQTPPLPLVLAWKNKRMEAPESESDKRNKQSESFTATDTNH